MRYDYIVIGAGPAGLSFASSVSDKTVLIIDMGKHVKERQHIKPDDIVVGAGGAGCFSDGKFSFFPAGTQLWNLDYSMLMRAYKNLTDELDEFMTVPPPPTRAEILNRTNNNDCSWNLKKYPSIYLDLKERIRLIEKLVLATDSILMEHEVINVKSLETKDYILTVKSNVKSNIFEITANTIIFAGGRFFPLFMPIKIPMKFRRYEFGFRIQTHANNPVLKGLTNTYDFSDVIDPKFRYIYNENIEFRTFCWCRNGEVSNSSYKGITTCSGRSDVDPTGLSNFGFLIRITSPDEMYLLHNIKPFKMSIKSVNMGIDFGYGQYIDNLLITALKTIIKEFPELNTDPDTTLIGPSIEGVGNYPDIDNNLKTTSGENIYCIGDCTGIFRGIVPSMLSGYYLANSLANSSGVKSIQP